MAAVLAGALAVLAAPAAGAGRVDPGRPPARLPFFAGERLTYRVQVGKLGSIGRGTMQVEGPVDVRGTSTLVLSFDLQAGVGPVKAVDRTRSWLDHGRMAALRFIKYERHLLSRGDERVELYPEERRWEAADGAAGASPSDAPLDELSFMYFIRTLPLEPDTVYAFDRHFEAARNPITVRVVGRDTIATSAGEFRTVVVEMRVQDRRRYKGEGAIRIYLTDDHCRLPVRIESPMPRVGMAVLTLVEHNHPAEHLAAGR